jgi:hypothetical protein
MLLTFPSAGSSSPGSHVSLYTIHGHVKSGEMRGTCSHSLREEIKSKGFAIQAQVCRQKKAVQSKN